MDLRLLRALVGDVDERMLRFVDVYVSRHMAVCMPIAGQCGYAVLPDHVHPAYMFVIPFDRRCRIRLDGREFTAPRGRMTALSPHVEHQEIPAHEAPRYLCFLLDTRFVARQAAPGKPPEFRGAHFAVPRGLLPKIRDFMAECRSALPGRDRTLWALSVLVCQAVLRAAAGGASQPAGPPGTPGIEAALQLLESCYSRPLDLAALARAANMSPDHFGRAFKARMGVTPMEHLRAIRLEAAKKMLLDEEKSVTQVALDCGFSAPAHFSTLFNRAYSFTPSAYRRWLQKGA